MIPIVLGVSLETYVASLKRPHSERVPAAAREVCDRNTVGVIPSEERDLLSAISLVGADQTDSSAPFGLCRNDGFNDFDKYFTYTKP